MAGLDSVLSTLGGVGAGYTQGVQNVQNIDYQNQMKKLRENQIALEGLQVEDAQRQHANEAADRAVASGFKPTTGTSTVQPGLAQASSLADQTQGTDADFQKASDDAVQSAISSNPIATTKQVDMGKVYAAQADAAAARGDMKGAAAHMQMKIAHDQLVREGAGESARLFATGAPAQQIESAFNSSGGARVVPGSTQIATDPTTGQRTLSAIDAATGQPINMNQDQAQAIMQMTGMIPYDKWSAAGNSGIIFNPRTGETQGEYHNGITVLGNGASAVQSDGEGGVKVLATNPKTFNPNSASGRAAAGGVHSVQHNADGTSTVLFRDGTQKTMVGDNGKPLIGAAARTAEIQIMGLATRSFDPAGDVNKANTLRAGVNDAVNPPAKNPNHGAAQQYLGQAKNQMDFNARVKALKGQGWTDAQIREMAQ